MWWWYFECEVECIPDSITIFRWLVKIRSMQLKIFPKLMFGSLITCLRPRIVLRECISAPISSFGTINRTICGYCIEINSHHGKIWTVSRYINYNFLQTDNKWIKVIDGLARGPVQWYFISVFVIYTYFQNKAFF